jgi:hypothetical protein
MIREIVALFALASAATIASGQAQPSAPQPPTDAASARAPAAPLLRPAWREPFDPGTLRIAVADTTGDGQDRVVALSAIDESRSGLTVFRWDGRRFLAEWRTELDDTQRLVVAGRFVPGAKDAQIVTASSWYRWDGREYVRHAFQGAHPPVGLLQRSDGSGALLTWEPSGVQAGSLDPGEAGAAAALVAEPDDPMAVWASGLLRARSDALAHLAPREYAAGGLLAFWIGERDARRRYVLPTGADRGAESALVIADEISPDGIKPRSRTEPLPGAVMDLALGDPKGRRSPLLLALTATGADGAGRALVAFSLADPEPAPARRPPPSRAARKPAR